MTEETKAQIIEHAKKEFPREACGLVVIERGKEKYWPCRNIAQNQKDFILAPEDYAAADSAGEIMAVVHSHCNQSPKPSQADLVACEASGLPWHIVALPTELWHSFKPSGYKAPLIGRQFVHAQLDCYSLIRDWYREERGIELIDFDRDEEWWLKGGDMYMENFRKAGFQPIDPKEIARGDVILMQVASKVANHGAIYLGDDLILHHLMNRLSSRDVYGGYWRTHTRAVIRYYGERG